MNIQTGVMEYQCPCCGAGLHFGGDVQKLTCEYCDNEFDIETVRAFNESQAMKDVIDIQLEEKSQQEWSSEEESKLNCFICPSCGAEIISDNTTAATFCPYCDNPTIMPGRLSGGLKPDSVIPFRTTKEDAKAAFLQLCKGKPLLPKEFAQEHRLEMITGMYVPFWLYDCSGDCSGSYKATRIHRWMDANYTYTRTEHFLLNRAAKASFSGIPMDGSSKMDDTFMESIEPFDYGQLIDFDTAYLSGYYADKYDVEADSGKDRIRQRVDNAMNDQIQSSLIGYSTVIPTSRQLQVSHSKARYVLLPVWMLNTKYRGKIYHFAMNGQTGKMTGTLPICPKRSAGWFAGIFAAVTALAYIIQLIAL